MNIKLQQTIEEEIAKISKELRSAIESVNWTQITEKIGRENLLSDDEINNLQVETLLVLVGIEFGENYEKNIENEVGLSSNEAKKISEEVMEKVFIPVLGTLEEHIKNNTNMSTVSPEQNLEFILSGGDYTSLITKKSDIIK